MEMFLKGGDTMERFLKESGIVEVAPREVTPWRWPLVNLNGGGPSGSSPMEVAPWRWTQWSSSKMVAPWRWPQWR